MAAPVPGIPQFLLPLSKTEQINPSYCRGAERLKKPKFRFQYTLRKCPDVGRRGKKRHGEGWRGDPALGLAPHTPGARTGPAALSGPALAMFSARFGQAKAAKPAQPSTCSPKNPLLQSQNADSPPLEPLHAPFDLFCLANDLTN